MRAKELAFVEYLGVGRINPRCVIWRKLLGLEEGSMDAVKK
jgi:hypothetical protein